MVREAESPIEKYTDSFDPQALFVYDGVPIKVWLSLYCPARNTFSAMIKEHGGRLCPSELGADVKIGDHLKSAPCKGQVSYKWIEDSIGDGILKETDDYIIAAHQKSLHKGPTARRTEFTPADDALLIKFVKRQASLGAPLSGNNIYESFAEMHPNHPPQSWRNRWVKVLSQRPDVLADTEISGPPSHAPKKTIGFLREHDAIILEAVRQPDAEPDSPDWWERFALKHVSYGFTTEQWKDRYFKRLLPVLNGTDNNNTQVKTHSPAPADSLVTTEVVPSTPNGIASTVPAKSPLLPRKLVPIRPYPPPQAVSPNATNHKPLSPENPSHYPEMSKVRGTQEPQTVGKPISKSDPARAMKTPVMPSDETKIPATDPAPLKRNGHFPAFRSTSVSTEERVRDLFSRPLMSPPPEPRSEHKRTPSGQSHKSTTSAPPVPHDSIVYQDPTQKAIIWKNSPKTPMIRMDDDDHMVHQQIQQNSGKRTNRVRVSLGDINIEIESSAGESPQIMSSPYLGRDLDRLSHEPSSRTKRRIGSAGASSRKATGGEIPSTPGSSPVKFKSESLATVEDAEEGMLLDNEPSGVEMMDIDEDVDLRELFSDDDRQPRNTEMQDVPDSYELMENVEIFPEHLPDQEIPSPSKSAQHGLGISTMGKETQALFGDEDEDLSIPNVEITPSPAKVNGIHPKTQSPGSRWIDNLESWVKLKAVRYSVSPEVVYLALERTGCKKKLAVQAVKHFIEHESMSLHVLTNEEMPKMKGIWTFEEDDILTGGDARAVRELDRKHGYGSAAERKLFLNVWAKSSREHMRREKYGFGGV